MITVLGLDQSTRCSGWAVITDGVIKEYGVIKTPSKIKGLDAALYQADAIEEMILLVGLKRIAIEKLFLNKEYSPDTIFLLGELRGMILHFAHQQDIVCHHVTTQDMCAHLGISAFSNRYAKKQASRKVAAMDLFFGDRSRWEEIPEDSADAINIASIAYSRLHLEARVAESLP